jgi:hypothetical protein
MDKLPAGIRNKFLKKQAAKTTSSDPDSGTATPNTLHSGTETQIPTPLKSSSPEIPFPLANLEECLACEDPCTAEEHAQYPNYIVKSIDRELPLAGSVKPYGRHLLVSTGKTDWIHSIDEEDGSVAQGIFRGLHDTKYGGRKRDGEARIVLSNTSFAPRRIGSGRTEVIIMPEWKLIQGVSKDTSSQFVERFVDGKEVAENGLAAETLPFHSMVLICSHGKRDKRCAVTSKYLVKAFESGLRRRDLYRSFDDTRTEAQGGIPGGGTVIGRLSHIGGHKFAGNVIIYRRRTKSVDQLHEKLKELTLTTVENPEDADFVRGEDQEDVQAEGIWLGRVEPKHVEAIIEEVILKGRVFKELYRGGLPSKYANLQF